MRPCSDRKRVFQLSVFEALSKTLRPRRFELHVFVCVHFSGNANVIMLASFVLHFAFRKCWVSTFRWPRFSLHLFDFSSQRKLVRDENGLLHFAFCICEITNFHLTLCDYVLEKRLTLWDGFVSFVPCGASVQHNESLGVIFCNDVLGVETPKTKWILKHGR